MKNIILFFTLAIALFAGFAVAHPNHDAPKTIDRQQAINMATHYMQRQVKYGNIDAIWNKIEATDAVFGRRDSRLGWIVSFNDPEQIDQHKKTFSCISFQHWLLALIRLQD